MYTTGVLSNQNKTDVGDLDSSTYNLRNRSEPRRALYFK